jgi:hypothetical protein
VSTLSWDAENSGLLLGLADFSVVHMRNAADKLRNAIKGLMLRGSNVAAGSQFTCCSSFFTNLLIQKYKY